jgi:peptidoglycan/LPS O-acetylase OafA/YrhL
LGNTVREFERKKEGAEARDKYRPDIDGLRAIAVFSVVAFHAFPVGVPSGFYGVDVFFVISGYLIGGIILRQLERNQFRFLNFYARRVRRIFPALLVILVASLLFGWFALLPTEYAQLGSHVVAASAFVSNFLLWSEAGYFGSAIDSKPLMHLWSLGVEEQFYILWPALLFAATRFSRNVVACIALVGLLSFGLLAINSNESEGASFYLPIFRFWELALGTILAATWMPLEAQPRAAAQRTHYYLRNGLSFLGLSTVLGAMFLPVSVRSSSGLWALIPTMGTLLVIACGPSSWINRRVLGNGLATWFGRISYPLYLWHWPLLSYAYIVDGDNPSTTQRVGVVVASVLLAALTYVIVEGPLRGGRHGGAKAIGLSLAMVAVGCAGLLIVHRDGYLERMPDFLRYVTSPAYYDAFIADARYGRCWLDPTREQTVFADECVVDSKRPSLFLWGDSYSAALYTGLEHHLPPMGYGLSQISGCPPIVGYDRPGWRLCPTITKYGIESIARVKPDIVLLVGNWIAHGLEGLPESIATLQRLGIKNIVLLGPMPHWRESLPRVILSYMMQNKGQMPPDRLQYGLIDMSPALDEQMRLLAASLKVGYISMYDTLCNQDGCQIWVGDRRGEILVGDGSHLTPAGSIYTVGLILDAVLRRSNAN